MGNRLMLTAILTGAIGLLNTVSSSAQPPVEFYRDYGPDQSFEYLRREKARKYNDYPILSYGNIPLTFRANPRKDNLLMPSQRTTIEFAYEFPRGVWVDNNSYKSGKYVIVPEGSAGSRNLYPTGLWEKAQGPNKGDKLKRVERRMNLDGTRTLVYILQKAEPKVQLNKNSYPDVSVPSNQLDTSKPDTTEIIPTPEALPNNPSPVNPSPNKF